MHVPQSYIEESVHTALTEDGGLEDVTSKLIPEDDFSFATVIARENAIICGVDWFEETFNQLDSEIFIEWSTDDGETIGVDQQICTLSGSTRALLTGERTALNFLQTLSGTASLAKQYVDAIAGTGARILDTRKTIPGLRMAQKYAVSCGGGLNHRMGLYDAILIKENHILSMGSIKDAVEAARINSPELPVEVEVENLAEFEQALAAKVERVLLDNFDIDMLKQAVKINHKQIELEASVGITLNNIRSIAETGGDYISTGANTKDIKAVDLSMRFS